MDADSWSARLSSPSKRYQLVLQSRSGNLKFPCIYYSFLGALWKIKVERQNCRFEELDGEDDAREEFPCPFCSEHFHIVGLCCHIDDEHPVEAKNGRKRKSHKGGSHLTLSLPRKGLQEGNLQALLGGSCIVSSPNSAPDPLSSLFVLPMVGDFVSVQPYFSRETNTTEDSSDVNKSERIVQSTPLSAKDQEEKAERCKFIQGLLLSSIIDDIL
ncbi:hypothetical protein V6N13_067214 [Hibiscus sabdariffa]|uniref:Uncharacterized protein n=1 Tax=Hibiscus sabdariffa TaxID=183260 RepID=A0ABR2DVZ7_9ROSI